MTLPPGRGLQAASASKPTWQNEWPVSLWTRKRRKRRAPPQLHSGGSVEMRPVSPYWGNGRVLPHLGPLGEGELSAALGSEKAFGLAKRWRTGSRSQRERVEMRENDCDLPARVPATELRPLPEPTATRTLRLATSREP